MGATNADVIINGVKARLADVEGRYKRRTVRREIQQQAIVQSENPVLRNREDGVALYQTSWAGGSRWWKPLMVPTDLASYFQANHMDAWSEPGKVIPGNKHVDVANTSIHDRCVMATDGTDVFAIGDTNTSDATQRDVYKWDAATNTFVRMVSPSSGIQDDSTPIAMTYNTSDKLFYVLAETAAGGREIGRFDATGGTEILSWFTTSSSLLYGSNIITTPFGLFYSGGGALVHLTTDVSPVATSVYQPGPNEPFTRSNTNVVADAPLTISTPQGIYMVRHTFDQGQPVATVFRVDRDVSGSFIGNPIAYLPIGTIVLSIQFHLGQLLMAATPDWRDFKDGEEDLEVVLYYVGEGGMGSLGSVLGGRDEMDETPYYFLGSTGHYVYLAGSKRLWVYDSVRAGLHPAWEWETVQADGGYKAMAHAQDSAGDEILLFLAKDRLNYVKTNDSDNPDTVTTFGDDETHYTLESNYFDGGVPMEQKTITRVAIIRDKDDGGSEWTLQISADDGAFADALVDSGTSLFAEAAVAITGYQFRYKLIYQTKDTTRSALRAVLVEMTSGDMVTEWDLILDGASLLNMDNERQNPDTFYTDMVTLGDVDGLTTLIDNYQTHERTEDGAGSGSSVKVMAVEINKDAPGESVVRVLVREK